MRADLFAEEVDAGEGNEHVGEAGQPVGFRQGRDPEHVEPANRPGDPGCEPRQDTHVPGGGKQELEAVAPGQVLGAGLQKELARCRERDGTKSEDYRLCLTS